MSSMAAGSTSPNFGMGIMKIYNQSQSQVGVIFIYKKVGEQSMLGWGRK
jgi:hypothetical protein